MKIVLLMIAFTLDFGCSAIIMLLLNWAFGMTFTWKAVAAIWAIIMLIMFMMADKHD